MNIIAECQLVQLRLLSGLLQNLLDEFTTTLTSFASQVKNDNYTITDHLLREALNHVSVNSAYIRDYQNLNYFITAFNLYNIADREPELNSNNLPDFTFSPLLTRQQTQVNVPLIKSPLSLPKL